mmetsp:Transcript_81065/g.229562  ORF Transcript_81065/g.229562 Transcript_81065/m.229562 type:complete len:248 (-) Transcript_81065:544-1287(-)
MELLRAHEFARRRLRPHAGSPVAAAAAAAASRSATSAGCSSPAAASSEPADSAGAPLGSAGPCSEASNWARSASTRPSRALVFSSVAASCPARGPSAVTAAAASSRDALAAWRHLSAASRSSALCMLPPSAASKAACADATAAARLSFSASKPASFSSKLTICCVTKASPASIALSANVSSSVGFFLRATLSAPLNEPSRPTFSSAWMTSFMALSRWRHSLPAKVPAFRGDSLVATRFSNSALSAWV